MSLKLNETFIERYINAGDENPHMEHLSADASKSPLGICASDHLLFLIQSSGTFTLVKVRPCMDHLSQPK